MQFAQVHRQPGFAGDRQFQHPRALRRVRAGRAFVRRIARGNQRDIGVERIARAARDREMAFVHRIEGAAVADQQPGRVHEASNRSAPLSATASSRRSSCSQASVDSSPTRPRPLEMRSTRPASARKRCQRSGGCLPSARL